MKLAVSFLTSAILAAAMAGCSDTGNSKADTEAKAAQARAEAEVAKAAQARVEAEVAKAAQAKAEAELAKVRAEAELAKHQAGSPKTQATLVNPDIFKSLYRVAKEIEGAQETGLTRTDFGNFLQKYATELAIAKDNAKTDNESKVLGLYSEALGIWQDSAFLWDAKISIPELKQNAKEYTDTFSGDNINLISLGFHYTLLLIDNKLPIQNFPSKEPNAVASLAKHYNLPVNEENQWRWINADSFKELWLMAGKKAIAADHLAKGR